MPPNCMTALPVRGFSRLMQPTGWPSGVRALLALAMQRAPAVIAGHPADGHWRYSVGNS
ncbi:hypothetical protein XHV734_3260 [Xanthomonas hortorum pv. vitians]|nr:hypothetical protein XHV734_3260 [Xanthomonas hortorum pv. vitians]